MPTSPRTVPQRSPVVLAAAVLAVLALGAPAQADDTVGGDRLATDGVVVDPGSPTLPDVKAESWVVADLDSGEVLAAKDPHGLYAPASTLKTLTALTLIPVVRAERRIVPTFDDVNVEGSKVGIVQRVAYPASELFSALLMVSGNDAANALATAAGGQEATAGLMNARALELGARDTHAVNPHGLDAEGQVSSAYDLALISRAGLADPDFARYVTTVSSSVSGPGGQRIAIRNKNKLLTTYPGALGVKNGYTVAAQASFVGAADRDGHRIVVTLMRATPRVFDEARKLLDWGFSAVDAEPVGTLVDDQRQAEQLPTVPASRLIGPPTGVQDLQDGTGLPVTLAGMALAAAAVFSVRRSVPVRRPGPAGRPATQRPPAPRLHGRHTPAQRRPDHAARATTSAAGRP